MFHTWGRGRLFVVLALSVAAIMVVAMAVGCGAKKTEVSKKADKKDSKAEPEEELVWPTRLHDTRRTGRSPYNGPGSSGTKWTYDAGAPIDTHSNAVIAKDGNIISGFQGKVVAVKPADGTVVWEYATGGASATSCRVAEDGTIYTSAGNAVHALTPQGTLKWSYDLGSKAEPPSLGKDSVVYAGSEGGKLVALTPDGQLKWEFQGAGNLHSPTIDRSGNLYCGGAPYILYALDKDGNKRWESKPAGDAPSLGGMPAWIASLEEPSIGDDGTIYVGSLIFSMEADGQMGKLFAITLDGQKKWEHAEANCLVHSPTIGHDGTLYAGTTAMKMIALKTDGSVLWEFSAGDGISNCPFVFSPTIGKDGLLYAGTSEGKLHCVNTDGTEKWNFQADAPSPGGHPNNFMPPAIGADGTIYATFSLGRIYALKAGGTK